MDDRDSIRDRLKRSFGHWIQFHPTFVDWTGSINAAIMFGVLWRWDEYGDNGWIYKTGKQWWQETRLSERQQRNARRRLRACGLVEERLSGLPAKLHFRIILAALENKASSVLSDGKKVRTRTYQSAQLSSNQRLEENNIHKGKTNKPGRGRPGALFPEEKLPKAVIKYAEFSMQHRWHQGVKGANGHGWKKTTLKQWSERYRHLRETADAVEVKGVMKWYFENWDNPDIRPPEARTFPSFCDKFVGIKAAIQRQRLLNGEPIHKSVISEYDEE